LHARLRPYLVLGAVLTLAAFAGPSARAATAEPPSLSSLCLNPPALTPVVPGDTPINDQRSINCFAWQEFIALNWLASGGPPSSFGRPGDLAPVAWEDFTDVSNLRIHLRSPRTAGSPALLDFGTELSPPETCPADDDATMTLRQTSKFSIEFDDDNSTGQAFPQNQPAWLADRDGNPVLYQILISRQEHEFLASHGLMAQDNQYPRLAFGTHVDMPRGSLGGDLGSIEIKAAWLVLPRGAGDEARWRQRYKLARARVYDEGDRDCEVRTVALVGLHVLHKTTSNPQWVWATFEHVDNAPDSSAATTDAAATAGDRYRFYSQRCVQRPVPESCQKLAVGDCKPLSPPVDETSCMPNTSPAYCLDLFNDECPPYPIQVTRLTPIADSGDNLVRQLDGAVQQLIRRQARPDSVWQYYQLVGTVWSGSPVEQNPPGSVPPLQPLSVAGMRPSVVALPVANTTLETYVQTATCLSCHLGAEIAVTDESGDQPYASDYSFVPQSLQEGGTTDEESAAMKAARSMEEER